MKKPRVKKTEDVVQKFITRFQAKANAQAYEYLLMETPHYVWILSPRRNGAERSVIWHLER